MEYRNPYAELSVQPAAFAAASERAAFLKKVYSLLFLGVLGFAATLWAAGNVGPVRDLMIGLWNLITQNRWGIFLYFGLFYGGSALVHAVATKSPINAIAYAAWAFLLGLLTAPIVFWAAGSQGPGIIAEASAITALVFGGLTVFVLWTGKDFSFLRGILFLAFWGLMIAMIAGAILGFTMGLWYSVAGVAFCAGVILYYTSEILHRFPTNMALSGAIVLFTQVVLMFQHILFLLMRNRD